MDWKAIAAMVVGALFIIGTDAFKFWKRKKPAPGGIVIGPARPSYPAGKIFIAHVLSTIAINILALIAFGVLQVMIDRHAHWAWSIVPLFGWLVVWGFVVRPMLFPREYLAYWDQQSTAPLGVLPAGLCTLGWMIVMIISSAPLLSVG